MLGYGLPRHVQVLAQLRQRLCITGIERVKQLPAAPVGKCSKYEVGIAHRRKSARLDCYASLCKQLLACQVHGACQAARHTLYPTAQRDGLDLSVDILLAHKGTRIP